MRGKLLDRGGHASSPADTDRQISSEQPRSQTWLEGLQPVQGPGQGDRGSLRVAYLVKRFPRLSETFVLNEFLELRRQGLDVCLYALMDPGERISQPSAVGLLPEVTYLHDARQSPRSWRRLAWGAWRQILAHPIGAPRVLWALVSVHRSVPSIRHAIEGLWLAGDLRRRGVSHLHAHFAHSPAAVAYLAFLAGGPPYSFTAHAKDLYTTLPRNVRIRARAARLVVTCTGFNQRYLQDMLAGTIAGTIADTIAGTIADTITTPVHVVYHGTDTQRFNPQGRRPEPGRIVSVGRLVPKKGFADLLRALELLAAEGRDFRCDIYGGGPLHDELEDQVRRAGLQARVGLHGPRMQDDILHAYRRAALFVLAPVVTADGDRDGIPNVLVEAMACEVPVVSTRISGIPELVQDGQEGMLVDPHDPRGLAAAIRRLLDQPELAACLGQAARRKVIASFDLAHNTRGLRQLFEDQMARTEPVVA
ncbi:MAG: glycosyltransferase family 4 protein [Chloroflexota bacterium]